MWWEMDPNILVTAKEKNRSFQATIAEPVPPDAGGWGGGGGTCRSLISTFLLSPSMRSYTRNGKRTSNRVFSAIILWIPIPTPSITAKRIAHPMAEFLAAFIPPLMASEPPVKKPAITNTHQTSAFHPHT